MNAIKDLVFALTPIVQFYARSTKCDCRVYQGTDTQAASTHECERCKTLKAWKYIEAQAKNPD